MKNKNAGDGILAVCLLLIIAAALYVVVVGVGYTWETMRQVDELHERMTQLETAEPVKPVVDAQAEEERRLNLEYLKLEIEYYQLLVGEYRKYVEAEPLH